MSNTSSVQGTTFQEKKCLILMDSLGVNLKHVYKADIIAKRGCSIEGLTSYMNEININQYTCVIIIIGTNDLTDRKVWNDFKKNKWNSKYKLKPHSTTDIEILKVRYTSLTDLIKSKNPDINIELSPIIPRLFDYNVNLAYLKSVNNMIKEFSRIHNYYHDRTLITSFLKFGKPDEKLYHNDGLHLSPQGTDKLSTILRLKTANLIKKSAATGAN